MLTLIKELHTASLIVVATLWFAFLFCGWGYRYYYRDERSKGNPLSPRSKMLYLFCLIPQTLLYLSFLPIFLLYWMQPKCWYCGERGHYQRNCPKRHADSVQHIAEHVATQVRSELNRGRGIGR